ncbi:hypothetical protein NDI45_12720 [Leptolyngbya sp. GB1-A1]|uniref:hypothetical protein n=1 Tax=Leptolyngbya sp. GB1-A1 TaxID=2933908 RepID=UPI003297069A
MVESLAAIRSQHKRMVAVVSKLPDVEKRLRHKKQRDLIELKRAEWRFIGERLDHLQGYTGDDPLHSYALSPLYKDLLEAKTEYYFAILNVLRRSFGIVRSKARQEGRAFSFRNACELFTEICRENANSIYTLFEEKPSQGIPLDGIRDLFTAESKLYRDAVSEAEQQEQLLQLRYGGWADFWKFAVWELRHTQLKSEWAEFLKRHKKLNAILKRTRFEDMRLAAVQSSFGVPSLSNGHELPEIGGYIPAGNALAVVNKT